MTLRPWHLLLVLAAFAVPIQAGALSGNGAGGLAVDASLDHCGVGPGGISCKINASWTGVEDADRYTATVTLADGSVSDMGTVGSGATGGASSFWVPYVGSGVYTVTVSAWGADEQGREKKVDEKDADAEVEDGSKGDGGGKGDDGADDEGGGGREDGDDATDGGKGDESGGGGSEGGDGGGHGTGEGTEEESSPGQGERPDGAGDETEPEPAPEPGAVPDSEAPSSEPAPDDSPDSDAGSSPTPGSGSGTDGGQDSAAEPAPVDAAVSG